MSKTVNCIFCGKKPEKKTKEHIIPQWLIKKTGDTKRKAFFGMPICDRDENGVYTEINKANPDNINEKGRVFSFDQFTFPACDKCNNEYSILEQKVINIYDKLSENDSINCEQIDLLLDWMDKVRIGLWLVFHRLDKNIADIEPNFAISSRMSCYDRILMVKRLKNQPQGLNFIGTESFAFAMMPSVFCLRINNLYFLNISSMFLISKGLGFPYIDSMTLDSDSDGLFLNPHQGTEKITQPIIDKNIWDDAMCIIQPMFKNSLVKIKSDYDLSELYNKDYVIENSLNHEKGKGAIFIIHKDGSIIKMKDGDHLKIDFSNESKDPYQDILKSHLEVLKWQSFLLSKHFKITNTEQLSEQQKKYVNDKYNLAQKINDELIQNTQNVLYGNMMLY